MASIGVSALGAVLSHQVASQVTAGLAGSASPPAAARATRSRTCPRCPARCAWCSSTRFGDATGHIFLCRVPFAVLALVCVLFIQEVPLRTTLLREDELDPEVAAEMHVR